MLSWDIYFNKIYFKFDEKEFIMDNGVEYYNQASLTPNFGVIEGTLSYEMNIRKQYFNKLIQEKKCHRIYQNYRIFYYCEKNKLLNDDLSSFPTLYFSSIELNYVFELNYEDLFLEKGEYIYFLILFYDYPKEIQNELDDYNSRWDLGMPFLKKYFFTFDYDSKYIGFYNTNIKIENKKPMIISKDNNSENKSYIGIILVVVFLFVTVSVYFFVKKYLIKIKRIKAIELESYNGEMNIKKSKYYNVEMGQKTLLDE